MDGWMDGRDRRMDEPIDRLVNGWMDGWMDGSFTTFFNSISVISHIRTMGGRVIMKGCELWEPNLQ